MAGDLGQIKGGIVSAQSRSGDQPAALSVEELLRKVERVVREVEAEPHQDADHWAGVLEAFRQSKLLPKH